MDRPPQTAHNKQLPRNRTFNKPLRFKNRPGRLVQEIPADPGPPGLFLVALVVNKLAAKDQVQAGWIPFAQNQAVQPGSVPAPILSDPVGNDLEQAKDLGLVKDNLARARWTERLEGIIDQPVVMKLALTATPGRRIVNPPLADQVRILPRFARFAQAARHWVGTWE